MAIIETWREEFFKTVVSSPFSEELKESSLTGNLKDWTRLLTAVVVAVCEKNNWVAAAKGHRLSVMPETREEYLGIDVMAFENNGHPWLFPHAAIELENSGQDDRISYSLWKVLNIKTKLRLVFCYRPEAEEGTKLVRYLSKQVIESMGITHRSELKGETLVVVGYRNRAETFPYSFFKWWILNSNTGQFEQY